MAPLPPVRKRTDLRDVRPDDLTFALFYDRILDTGAMRADREFDAPPEKIAKKTRKGRKWGQNR